jgi:hypothetical protein
VIQSVEAMILSGSIPDALLMLRRLDDRPAFIGLRLVQEAVNMALGNIEDNGRFARSLQKQLFTKEAQVQAAVVDAMAAFTGMLLAKPEHGSVPRVNVDAVRTIIAAAVPADPRLHGVFRDLLNVSRAMVKRAVQLRQDHVDNQRKEWKLVSVKGTRRSGLSTEAMRICHDWLHTDDASLELNSDRTTMDVYRKLTGYRQVQFEYLVGIMLVPSDTSANDGETLKKYMYVVLLSLSCSASALLCHRRTHAVTIYTRAAEVSRTNSPCTNLSPTCHQVPHQTCKARHER